MVGSNRSELLVHLDVLNVNKEKKEDKSLLPGKRQESQEE